MKSNSDEELMSLVKRQCMSAFEELLERYERRMFTFFLRLVDGPDRARDYTQETFLRVWRSRTSYASQGRFSSYLFWIAKNYFIDSQRKEQHRIAAEQQKICDDNGLGPEMARDPDGCQELFTSELRGAISEAIARLPEVHRLVYVLSEEQRLSYREIAEILDCPIGTVSSRKVEAVKKLRLWLRPLKDELFSDAGKTDGSG
jgi:RNA polymerase sigma-70 factor, ECF subfamily